MSSQHRRHLSLVPFILAACFSACGPDEPSTGPGELPPIPAEATAWLQAHLLPLDQVEPSDDLSDLEPLRALVGHARIVALGEATHGTREFFQLKDRMARFLIREMGFDAVAFEAPWAEANRLDDFVVTGEGDAEELLSGLYLWPWNTTEVLDLVRWMRSRAGAAPEDGVVRFLGVDMQFPGMPILNVLDFLARVDPGARSEVGAALECLARFANDHAGAFPEPGYAEQLSQSYRDPCRRSLDEVRGLLLDREAEYSAASSPAAFARALRSIRVAIQFEDYTSSRTPHGRDRFMAENALWLLDQLGPGARLILWAHNYHVSNMPGYMGRELKGALGDDVVLVGFNFFRGAFNASAPGVPTHLGEPIPHTVDGPVAFSYGHYFHSAGVPHFLLDLRDRDYTAPGAGWVPGPRPLRAIGSDFDPHEPDDFFWASRLPDEFDVIVYVEESSPSSLLPLRYPDGF